MLSIFIPKAIDFTSKSKRFSSPSNLQAFKRYLCIYKEQKGHSIEENQQRISSFFHLFKEFCCITNKGKRKNGYEWMGKWLLRQTSRFPVDTGRKMNVHKTFRRRPVSLLNVLSTFNLRPVYTGIYTMDIKN